MAECGIRYARTPHGTSQPQNDGLRVLLNENKASRHSFLFPQNNVLRIAQRREEMSACFIFVYLLRLQRRLFDRRNNRGCHMIRLSRAGREAAIVQAVLQLEKAGRFRCFTKGEICRRMGIKSTSRIRDMLRQLVKDGRLVSGMYSSGNWSHEVEVFGYPHYEQIPLPDHSININGKSCELIHAKDVRSDE